MKRTNLLYPLIMMAFAVFMSCERNDPGTTTDFERLVVADPFTWSTGNTVMLTVTGLPTVIPVTQTLSVSLPDGSVILRQTHSMDASAELPLSVPNTVNELVVTFGTLRWQVPVAGNQASVSFIPVITE